MVMGKLARAVGILLIVVFAVGTVAHAAAATSMLLAMSAAEMGDDMDGCAGCPEDDGDAGSCDVACVASFAALPQDTGAAALFQSCAIVAPAIPCHGHTGPPDPYPPRNAVLI